jgi:hypothetical protein
MKTGKGGRENYLLIVSLTLHASPTKFIHFRSMPQLAAVQMRSRLWLVAAFLFLSTLLVGCASLASRGLFPEVKARRPPEVELGVELILLNEPNEPVKFSTSLISADGRAHVFVANAKRQLEHIEILGDKILAHELLGGIRTHRGLALEAVEHPPGKLRVLAGDRQYVRAAPDQQWQEVKGNRCSRFVPVGDDLFCAFVIKGEEIEAPKRTDVTFGWFILVPVVFWSNKQASKLVVAHESADGWTIRAVLDPDTILDADSDFMVGTDSLGTLHFLYSTSRGGGSFYVFAGPYGGGGSGGHRPSPELRFAQVAFDRLLVPPTDSHTQGLSPGIATTPWVPIEGTFLSQMPTPYTPGDSRLVGLRPFDRHFAVNKASGEVRGLMWIGGGRLDDGVRKLDFGNPLRPDNAWVEVGIRDGSWARGFDVVVAKDLPDTTYSWDSWRGDDALKIDPNALKIDPKGNIHALLGHGGFWKPTRSMSYLIKEGGNWSAPLTLGSNSSVWWEDIRALAVGNDGAAFAAWVNSESKFVGRWIRPRGKSLP